MAEIKRTFSASKMNKDIDERLVPPAEYRDALNVQVNTSEGSNVGTVQPILGNTVISTHVPTGSFCVGSIANTKTDKIYWLVAGASSTTNNVTTYKDYILEHDVQNNKTKYVFVDIYKVEATAPATSAITNGWIYVPEVSNIETYNNTGIRIDMKIQSTGSFQTNPLLVHDIRFDTGNNRWKIYTDTVLNGGTKADIATSSSDVITFYSERVLNFNSTRLITGLNILDGMLFWTDNFSEPKKINIDRSIKGTGGDNYLKGVSAAAVTGGFASAVTINTHQTFNGGNDNWHTRLVSSNDGFTLETMTDRLGKKAVWIEEENITTIRKGPHTPPYLKMSRTDIQRVDNNGNVNATDTLLSNYAFSNNGILLSGGDGPFSITFNNNVDFKIGDVLILTTDTSLSVNAFSSDLAEVRISITNVPAGTAPFTGPYSYVVLSIDSNIGVAQQNFLVKLEKTKALFEYKFPRFAYRYKYKDGEYSTFSPFSEPAFLPGDYDYASKKGHNLGMKNQLRSLKITDYVVENAAKGQDVVEIDILIKHEDSPNIYTVKTIKPTDTHPEWPDLANYSSARGEYTIESELIHATVPSNQLLRPWDNVPLKAKAQDITANRLIYGNYVQNYNIIDTPVIDVSIESSLGDLANGVVNSVPTPSKSVKSLRTYQVGVVYRDKYGRETPVLTGDSVKSVVEVEPNQAKAFNKITAKMDSVPPSWADSYKFFIKETSNEYYSLAMDRWYDAEDGNIWISFPSSERNKINIHKTDRETDNTILILKKQHTTDLSVDTGVKYKVIDIENEAPEFIKRNTKKLGRLTNTTANQVIQQSSAGFPFEDGESFIVDEEEFLNEFMTASTNTLGDRVIDTNIREAMHNGFLFVKFFSGVVDSAYYKVSNMTADGSILRINIDGRFGSDITFLAPGGTTASIVGGVGMQLTTQIPEDKAEFDGRFFVKILNDINLRDNVISYSGGINDWTVVNALQSYYLHYETIDGGSAPVANQTHDPTPGTTELINDKGNGATATYRFLPKMANTASNLNIVKGFNNPLVGGILGLAQDDRKEAVAQWWVAWGYGWFIDSAITANEDADGGTSGGTGSQNMTNINDQAVYSDITDGTHGIFDLPAANFNDGNTGITGIGKGLALGFSGIGGAENTYQDNKPEDFNVGGTQNTNQASVVELIETIGTQFRFSDDPEKIVYTVKNFSFLENRYNYDSNDSTGPGAFDHGANKRKTWKLVVEDANGFGIGNANGLGVSYNPTNFTNDNGDWGTIASSSSPVRIEFVTPFLEDGQQETTQNPAVWETEPKEDVGLDIYYEATSAIPLDLNLKTNEQFAKYGSAAENETTSFGVALTVKAWSDQTVTLSAQIPTAVAVGDIIAFTAPDGGVTRLEVKTAVTASTTSKIEFVNETHSKKVTLPYFNCYSFQNGVESNRIRDDYNETYLKNGVKASTVLAKHYEEERRGAGMIHSGIYNSTSGVNELNQFRQAEPITKDLNPRHGSIQSLFNRDTDLIALTEDKCFKVLANKDALFNADGSSQLISKSKVLGQATPFAGNFGTINPESVAQDNYRAYFVDRTRGKVCRLSKDGITPISSAGMHDWFADNLKVSTSTLKNSIETVFGSFDSKKGLYNVSIKKLGESIEGSPAESPAYVNYTLSYSEMAKGWVSFKSFYPETGLSINNDFYTFNDGELWKHHSNETRNNFYGVQYYSDITTILNDQPGSIKSFNTINYEGSQAKITQQKFEATDTIADAAGNNVSKFDGKYYNLNAKTGWYVDTFETNEQSATIHEFVEKEGKWFNTIRGVATTLDNLDQQEFSVQGIGVPSAVSSSGTTNDVYKFKVTNNVSTTYVGADGSGDKWDATAD